MALTGQMDKGDDCRIQLNKCNIFTVPDCISFEAILLIVCPKYSDNDLCIFYFPFLYVIPMLFYLLLDSFCVHLISRHKPQCSTFGQCKDRKSQPVALYLMT